MDSTSLSISITLNEVSIVLGRFPSAFRHAYDWRWQDETRENRCDCRPGCRQWVSVGKNRSHVDMCPCLRVNTGGIDWKEAAPEMKIKGDPYDQTWLLCGSWRPAYFRARFQLAASSLRTRLPEGGIGKLWAQGLGPHQSEQELSLDPCPNNATSSLVLYAEPAHSNIITSRIRKASFKQ